MNDDQDSLPGLGPVPERGPRTLRDLVGAAGTRSGSSPMETFLTAPEAAGGAEGRLRLGFPSSDQLARFVAGQHQRLLEHLDLPAPLRLVGGGHLERKRFFSGGRVAAPDLVLAGPENELVLVYTISPLAEPLRLPDPTSLDVVRSLGHEVVGILVTPDPPDHLVERVEESLARFGPANPMHWVRYRIDLEIV